jgi:hypothetical protein
MSVGYLLPVLKFNKLNTLLSVPFAQSSSLSVGERFGLFAFRQKIWVYAVATATAKSVRTSKASAVPIAVLYCCLDTLVLAKW